MTDGFCFSFIVEFKGQFATKWLYVPHFEIQITKLLFDKKETNPPEIRLTKLDTVMGTLVSLYYERKLIH
jgi:hypothetical protein